MAIIPPKPFKLTLQQKESITRSQEWIAVMEKEIARARDAGVDVSEHETRLLQARRQADGLLRVYG